MIELLLLSFVTTSGLNSTCASPACSVPPGPVKSSSLLVQMWSRKSSIIFWFSSAPMKRFHLSVFTRSTQKACSLRKSTLSSDNTTPTLSEGAWDTCTPPAPPLPKPLASLLVLLASAMKTRREKKQEDHYSAVQFVGAQKPSKYNHVEAGKRCELTLILPATFQSYSFVCHNTMSSFSCPFRCLLSSALRAISWKSDTHLTGWVSLSCDRTAQSNFYLLKAVSIACGLQPDPVTRDMREDLTSMTPAGQVRELHL